MRPIRTGKIASGCRREERVHFGGGEVRRSWSTCIDREDGDEVFGVEIGVPDTDVHAHIATTRVARIWITTLKRMLWYGMVIYGDGILGQSI